MYKELEVILEIHPDHPQNRLINRVVEVLRQDGVIVYPSDTSYGLGNYVQTQDKEKAKRVARKFRSGGVYINGNSADPGTPFGGYRQSGNGREGGDWGLEEYLEIKTICGWE